jgi:hypothetical protein
LYGNLIFEKKTGQIMENKIVNIVNFIRAVEPRRPMDLHKPVVFQMELAKQYEREFGKYEFEIERYYDHCLCCRVLEHITRRPQGIIID